MSTAYNKDFATGKRVNLSKPEEPVRQEFEKILCRDYNYTKAHLDIEVSIQMGSSIKTCDIAVYDDPKKSNIIGIIETKAPKITDGKKQLISYMAATPTCLWGVWTNGDEIEYAVKNRQTGKITFSPALLIPRCGEFYTSIKKYDHLRPASNLKFIFRIINNSLYANANLVRSEQQGAEMVRLIFCKMADEYSIRNTDKAPEFQVYENELSSATYKRIQKLWEATKNNWFATGIFDDDEKIKIDANSVQYIVSQLQNYSLLKTDRDAVGDAFEVFSGKQFAGEKGQFFTPRSVVNMVVDIIQPNKNEKIIDPACGSGGFLIAALDYITEDIQDDIEKKAIAENCLWGIDKEKDLAKICKAYMSLMGDGRSNIVQADSLRYKTDWDSSPQAKAKLLEGDELKQFDIVITNPPFGSKIKVVTDDVLEDYDLGHKWKYTKDKGWEKTAKTKNTPPQILFIELCLRLLKPNGRLGIVLPDGLLGNPTDSYIRHWIEERADILAVISCPVATFMPHTGTKTSVLILKKTKEKTRNVFFAIAENCGHTMRGREIYDENKNLKEDFSEIANNYNQRKTDSHLGFFIQDLKRGILVPNYYDPRIASEIDKLKKGNYYDMFSMKELQKQNELSVRGVPASASSEEYDIHGDIRFIRTSDISSYELYRETQKKVSNETFMKYTGKQDLKFGDILFVKDGDNKIGSLAILLDERDTNVLVQTHFKKIRPIKMDPFLLLWALKQDIVKKQVRQRVFSQSTLSTIGDRILELQLPIPKDPLKKQEKAQKMKELIETRKKLLHRIEEL